MKRETLLTFAVAVLFLLNVGTIGFLYMNHVVRHIPPHHRPPIDDLIIDGLELTDVQQDKFEELKHNHRTQMIALDKEYDAAVKQYFNLLKSDTIEMVSRDSFELRIGSIQIQRAKVTLAHFAELKSICTEAQKKKFDSIIPKLVQIMVPPRHPAGRPPH
jgi:Spy/CpxP family protein refolding chaperone